MYVCMLRKTIVGHLDSIPSLIFNIREMKTKLNMHAFHSSRYLYSNWMCNLSHT